MKIYQSKLINNFFWLNGKTLGVEVALAVVFDDFFIEYGYIDSIFSSLISIVLPDSLGYNYRCIAVVLSNLTTKLSDLV